MTRERLPPRRRLLPLRRLLPPRIEDTGVAPKILSTRVHPNPNPLYLYALFSITYQLSLTCHLIMSHCICGFGV